MRVIGLNVADGKAALFVRYSDGIHFNMMGLDPRGAAELGSALDSTTGALASLVVSPTPVSMPTGGSTIEFVAFGFDASGNLIDVTPTWSIVEGAPFATINSGTGILTSGSIGEQETITVRATSGSITADATVTIVDLTIDSLTVSPSTWNMTTGSDKLFSAVGHAGAVQVAVAPVWSLVSGVGSIDAATGRYTAGTVSGSATIRATVGAITDDATITVNPATMTSMTITPNNPSVAGGTTQSFTVVGKDANGNTVGFDSSPIQWFCHSIGSVISNGEEGILTAPASSTTQLFKNAIEVTYKTLSASADWTLTPGEGGGPAE